MYYIIIATITVVFLDANLKLFIGNIFSLDGIKLDQTLTRFFSWFLRSTIFTQLAKCTIFIEKVVHAKIASTASTMFRQAHETNNTVHLNKKDMRVVESIRKN
ncbi:Uncharacterised protein [uncultured archaeon]|nr:Uncharacterised protein [uncultured archaeon]